MRKIPEEIVQKLGEYLELKQYYFDPKKGWFIVVEGRRNWDGSGAWQARHISMWSDILEAWGIEV